MKANWIVYTLFILLFCTLLQSCGCGFTFLYNWRPKPWNHKLVVNSNTRLSNLININGYYTTQDSIYQHSIMFYENGLCASVVKAYTYFSEDKPYSYQDSHMAYNNLSLVYSNKAHRNRNLEEYFIKDKISWGTYEIDNDTIKAYVIENLLGCDGTRKNVVSMKYLIEDKKQLRQLFISNSSRLYGYSKELDVANCEFYPVEDKRDSTQCPYLNKKWFYKSDKK